jgi:hypothetical protein
VLAVTYKIVSIVLLLCYKYVNYSYVTDNLAWCGISRGRGTVAQPKRCVDAEICFSLHDVIDNSISEDQWISYYLGFVSVKMPRMYKRRKNRASWTQEDLNNATKCCNWTENENWQAGKNLIFQKELFVRGWFQKTLINVNSEYLRVFVVRSNLNYPCTLKD